MLLYAHRQNGENNVYDDLFIGFCQVGTIPQGLPPFSVPKHFGNVPDLILTAMLITGVAILVSQV